MKNKKAGFSAVFISITSVLIMLGLLLAFFVTAQKAINHLENNLSIFAYFAPNTPKHAVEKTKLEFQKSNYFTRLQLVSPEDASSLFKEELGNDYLNIFKENPFPHTIKLYPKKEFLNENELDGIIKFCQNQEYIYEVETQANLIQQLNRNKNLSKNIGLIILLISVTIAVILINNTIKLQIFSDRFKVKSMQLVGASEWFIQKPYILKSFLLAIIASFVASSIVFGLLKMVIKKMHFADFGNKLIDFSDIQIYSLLFVTLLIAGQLISLLSTFWATKKYLRSNINELY